MLSYKKWSRGSPEVLRERSDRLADFEPKTFELVATPPKGWLRCRDFLRAHRLKVVAAGSFVIYFIVTFAVYRVESVAPKANITSYGAALWWGIVTSLTIGYGDFYPVTNIGRLFAGLLMFTGVVGIGIMTAKISAIFLADVLLEGRGIVDRTALHGHFVLCGWKDDMRDLLLHILDFNKDLTSDKIVIVANIRHAVIDDLKADPRLRDMHVVYGDYFQQSTLERAAPERAQKVIILADRTPGPGGQVPNAMEADARTIMTAITLSNIARGTLVTAEIIDPKLDHYLKLAGVSEIIYSREYSRLLLGRASGGTGIVNVVHALIDPTHSEHISTPMIDEAFIHKSYSEFKVHYEKQHGHAMVIGILENAGNPHRMKELALREAQKTADVTKLIQNLGTVKNLKWNSPVFNPKADYVIGKGAAAIVITGTAKEAA